MAKYYGKVGYSPTETDEYGVASPKIIERYYYGDVLKLSTRWQETEHLNDDITVNHRISIVADAYAYQNFPYIRYVEWMGVRWLVRTVDVEPPRLILTLGGVYNGPQTESA